jgi:hypothetical protein
VPIKFRFSTFELAHLGVDGIRRAACNKQSTVFAKFGEDSRR